MHKGIESITILGFDEEDNLTDGKTREHLRRLVVALAEWTPRLQSQAQA